jgi:hypothetical protein
MTYCFGPAVVAIETILKGTRALGSGPRSGPAISPSRRDLSDAALWPVPAIDPVPSNDRERIDVDR